MSRLNLPVTLTSSVIGAISHVGWDAFTHNGRWGAQHIGWLRHQRVSVAGQPVTGATALQYASTVVGTVVTLVLLRETARRRLLTRWTGRAVSPDRLSRPLPRFGFWLLVALGGAAGIGWAISGSVGPTAAVNRSALGIGAGLVIAGAIGGGLPVQC